MELTLTPTYPATHRILVASLFSSLAAMTWPGLAAAGPAPARHRSAAAPDVLDDFRALAAQRPWTCPDQAGAAAADSSWVAEPALCAWQNRLRMRRWHGQGGGRSPHCLSPEARFWTWARFQSPALSDKAVPWRSAWTSQSFSDVFASERRLIILRRGGGGQWSATEWRWRPSERPATRRWQESRWQLLVAAADRLQQPTAASPWSAADARLLWPVLAAHLGKRASEVSGNSVKWQSAGRCLQVDHGAPGPQQLQLSYAVDDSRLEQRSALQLQLARRFPNATWLTPFSLVPQPAQAHGGAKFYAVWTDAGVLAGQLWLPMRGDGAMQRVRITTPLAEAPAQSTQGAAAGKHLIESELFAFASTWAQRYD